MSEIFELLDLISFDIQTTETKVLETGGGGVRRWLFDHRAYQKMILLGVEKEWLIGLKQIYPKSKQHYLDRPITYQNFATILRQICRLRGIRYEIQTQYHYSQFQQNYWIYEKYT